MTTAPTTADALERDIRHYIDQGYSVERETPDSAVLIGGRRVNHLLHLILSILTLGVWALFVWLPMGLFGGQRRIILTVRADGTVKAKRQRV